MTTKTIQTALGSVRTAFDLLIKNEPGVEMVSIPVYELQQLHRFAELGRLSSGIIHDLANPLTTVTLSLEHLQSQASSPQINRALAGTRTMQLYVKAARSQISGNHEAERFTVGQIIDNIEQMTAYKARQLNVTIQVDCQVDLLLSGSPVRLQQALSNLVSNAIESYRDLPPGSRLVEIRAQTRRASMTIDVTDHGCGISDAHLKKIFEPFFTTKIIHQGTGIGLAITKGIIENEFGGSIVVVSKPGQGTTFRLTLPK